MKIRVTASVPTIYQMNSLKTLIGSMPFETNPDGSFSFSYEFPAKREASQWMKLKEMLAEINKYDTLTADTLTIRIEAIK